MSKDLDDLILPAMQVSFSEDLVCSSLKGSQPIWLVSHQESKTPHAIIRQLEEGLLVESRWQLGMVWRDDCLFLSHDSHQRGSVFEEDLTLSETSKASLVYRLGE